MASHSLSKNKNIGTNYFEFIWENGRALDPDVTIELNSGEHIGAHKFLLADKSEYFANLLCQNPDQKALKIPRELNIQADTFKDLLQILYGQESCLNLENSIEIKEASVSLGCTECTCICEEYIRKNRYSKKSIGGIKRRDRIGSVALLLLERDGPQGSQIDKEEKNEERCEDKKEQKVFRNFLDLIWQQDRKLLSDVKIIAGGVEFAAHKLVLTCHSRFFAHVFRMAPGTISVRLCDSIPVSAFTFSSLLKYMYTDVLEITVHNADNLLLASEALKMPHLSALIRETYFPTISTPRELPTLIAKLNKSGPEPGLVESFYDLSLEKVVNALSNDYVLARNEFAIFLAAHNWLKNTNDPGHYLVPVMNCVRFQNFSKQELAAAVNMTKYWCQRYPQYRDIILRANWYEYIKTCRVNSLSYYSN
ncbi:unnamed protein product [Gordionus sp. m RMFG-2023]